MLVRFLAAIVVAVALVGCSSPTIAPATPAASNAVGPTPVPTAVTPAASATPAAGNPGGSSGTATVDGLWTGTWTKPAGGGAITLHLQQSGVNVSGTVTMVGSACLPADTAVSGSITGPNIVLTATGSGFKAMFGGEFTGDAMTGTLTASCSLGSATGTWQVKRT